MDDNRRKRINLYKKVIIGFILLCILIPVVICVILIGKVARLEKKVEALMEKQAESTVLLEQTVSIETDVPEDCEKDVTETSEKEEETTAFPDGKVVYLTFDDGPSVNTDRILDVLKEYNIKATFFVTGKTDESSVAAYRRIVDEGHTLGMHSYSHVYSQIYESEEAFTEDLEKLQNYLYGITGILPVFYRFPGGSSNTISKVDMQLFIKILHERGIEYFDWNVSNGDAMSKTPDVEDMIENVLKDVKYYDQSVVLMHDAGNKDRTVEALPLMLDKLIELECTMLPLEETSKPVQHVKPEE